MQKSLGAFPSTRVDVIQILKRPETFSSQFSVQKFKLKDPQFTFTSELKRQGTRFTPVDGVKATKLAIEQPFC